MVEAQSIIMEDPPNPASKTASRKRKKKTKSPVEPKNIKLDETSENSAVQKTESPQVVFESLSMDKINEKYPVLKNEELVEKFMKVPINNNQKGRIRQVLRDNLKGTSEHLLPDVINNKIQAVLTKTTELADTDLRKIRILYNMLKTAIMAEKGVADKKIADKKIAKEKKLINKEKSEDSIEKVERPERIKPDVKDVKKEQLVQKVKGKKRYVVFIGNLPLGVNKETLMSHFSELTSNIVDVRIPPPRDDKKSAIAYLELKDEPTYEMALSKHHSMLGTKRINVLYSTQQGTKISKTEAKSKSAKLVALQKSGALIGSTALAKKRSQRRAKLRKARAAEEKANA